MNGWGRKKLKKSCRWREFWNEESVSKKKNKLAESQRIAEENQKKLYEDVKTKAPEIDRMAKAFKNNSDLEDGIGFDINQCINWLGRIHCWRNSQDDKKMISLKKILQNSRQMMMQAKIHIKCIKSTQNIKILEIFQSNIKQEAEQPLKNTIQLHITTRYFTRFEGYSSFSRDIQKKLTF